MDVSLFANTDGKGQWTTEQREIEVVKIKLAINSDKDENGQYDMVEVRAYMNLKTFHPAKHGLPYTDARFLREFRQGLVELGVDPRDARKVDYTEQGMQGKNYVSFGLYDRNAIDRFIDFGFQVMQDPWNRYHGKEVEARKAKERARSSRKSTSKRGQGQTKSRRQAA